MQETTWTREETIIAFNVYCKIPFKESSKAHPLVVKYANIIGRTPSAFNMKIGNIGRLDPTLRSRGISGLTHGAKMEQEVWNEFSEHPEYLAYESERLIAKYTNQEVEQSSEIQIDDLPLGIEREAIVKQRVNQSFFRKAVISAYDSHCCISGVGNKELLEACHIIDWTQDESIRTNPQNGLCLNAFFHKAYDKFLCAITPDFIIAVSDELIYNTIDERFKTYLNGLNGNKIALPDRFLPKQEFLDIHYQKYKENHWNATCRRDTTYMDTK